MTGKALSHQQSHVQTRATSAGVPLPSAAAPVFLPLAAPQVINGAYANTVTLSGNYLNLTVTSAGSIDPGAGALGVYAQTAGVYVRNDGSIYGGGGQPSYGFRTTGGDGGTAIDLTAGGTLVNSGTITGGTGGYATFSGTGGDGAMLTNVQVTNSGVIRGGAGGGGYSGGAAGAGISLDGGTILNTGTIAGGNAGNVTSGGAAGGDGVILIGGTLINGGTISGGGGYGGAPGGYAVTLDGNTMNTVVVDPGAVFNGQVGTGTAQPGAAQTLDFSGTSAATLTGIGTQFTGFNDFGFEAGAQWSIEGTYTALAGGQTIAGLATGDTITLDGFVETSETYVAGIGVELGNGSTTVTLALTGNYTGETFRVTTSGGDTTVALPGPVSTISTAVYTQVSLASAAYAATLTVTGSGSVAPGGYGTAAIYATTPGVSLLNSGAITGSAGSCYSADQTGGAGVLFTGVGTIVNDGNIAGGDGRSAQYGPNAGRYAAAGGAGIDLGGGMLTNNGSITGGSGGSGFSPNAGGGNGAELHGVTLVNTGAISGGSGGGGAYGARGGIGLVQIGGSAINTGSITGGAGGHGSYYPGTGGIGVVLNGGVFTNDGTISGGTGGANYSYYGGANGANGPAMLVDGGTGSTLVIDPGAVFNGGVYVFGGTAALELGGATPGTLTGVGTQFTGFTSLGFEAGAAWSVEGTYTALAGGQAIAGFAAGDSVTLDGFLATSETYVAGTGVELGNGSTTVTLALTGNYVGETFQISTYGADTTVALPPIGQISTITNAVTTSVTLATNAYAGQLTVAASGSVTAAAYGADGVYGNTARVSLLNLGQITGGAGSFGTDFGLAGAGVALSQQGRVTNDGSIIGGVGAAAGAQQNGGGGGDGVDMAGGGTLTNGGSITGGAAGYGNYGVGGEGVLLRGGVLMNGGTITGGGAYGAGSDSAGVGVFGGGTIFNTGVIAGGSGGNGNDGVNMHYGTLTNTGRIAGGHGGGGGTGAALFGGTLINQGTIGGGAGIGDGGGLGVFLTGATLINAGTISGGARLDFAPVTAVGIQGNSGAVLVIDPGARFNGNVATYDGTAALELGGTTAGTLSGLGTQFTGFNPVTVEAGSNWTLAGKNTLGGATLLTVDGRLNVNGKLKETGIVTVTQDGELRAGGNGVVLLDTIMLAGGTLAAGAGAKIVVGTSAAGTSAGGVSVTKGHSLDGSGLIGGVAGSIVTDNGSIAASGGTLTLARAVTGTGTLAIADGASLEAKLGLSVASLAFEGAGTLVLDTPAAVTTPIAGFAGGDTIDLANLKVISVGFANDTLTLLGRGHVTLGKLLFTGDYAASNFALSASGGGTDISYTATPAAADFAPSLGTAPMLAPTRHIDPGWHAENPLNPMTDWLSPHSFGH